MKTIYFSSRRSFFRALVPAIAVWLGFPVLLWAVPVGGIPDVSVSKNARSGFVGEGVANTSGDGQTITIKTKRKTVEVYFNLKNNEGAYAYKGSGSSLSDINCVNVRKKRTKR